MLNLLLLRWAPWWDDFRVGIRGHVRLQLCALGVNSGLHGIFSHPEGSAELQMAWFPPVWQTQSWGVTEASLIYTGMNLRSGQSSGLGGQASEHESLYTLPRVRVKG